MKIHNVRLGFATNSSSTHSIVIFPTTISDSLISNNEFGCQFFTASSKDAKSAYLLTTLYSNLLRHFERPIFAEAIIRDQFGIGTLNSVQSLHKEGAYIDHQSMITLPLSWDGEDINIEFFRDLYQAVLQDHVAILGGDDGAEGHPLLHKGMKLKWASRLPVDTYHYVVAKKDRLGFWTLFNRKNGVKIRFSFNDANITHAASPELVDIKLTDYCPINCAHCYQDSTIHGEHAEFTKIATILRILGKMHVFEVALGGGETTMHPRFVDILKTARDNHIVPNFTTKLVSWIRDPEIRQPVIDHVGGFAFSVSNIQEARKFEDTIKKYWPSGNNVEISIQAVLGVFTINELRFLVYLCAENNFKLTLLGYKETGRGKNVTPNDSSQWLDIIKEATKSNHVRVGIDTVLAQQYKKELQDTGIPRILYETEEGKFSCYIDSVNMTMHKSSYDDSEGVSLEHETERWGSPLKYIESWYDAFAEIQGL